MTGSDRLYEEAQPTRPMLLSLRAALRRGNPEVLIQKSLFFRAELYRRKLLATTGYDWNTSRPATLNTHFSRRILA